MYTIRFFREESLPHLRHIDVKTGGLCPHPHPTMRFQLLKLLRTRPKVFPSRGGRSGTLIPDMVLRSAFFRLHPRVQGRNPGRLQGVMGFLGDLRGRIENPPDPLGPAERVFLFLKQDYHRFLIHPLSRKVSLQNLRAKGTRKHLFRIWCCGLHPSAFIPGSRVASGELA